MLAAQFLDVLFQVRLGPSRLRLPVSRRDCAISRRTAMNNAGWRHLLLTGRPGVGKTTLVRAVVSRLAAFRPAGFYTEEIRDQGARLGFRLVTLDGRELVLAHTSRRGPRVGRYGVDVAGFERLLADLDLRHATARLLVIDEIGKMECLSRRFAEEIEALLDAATPVLATVALRGQGLISRVKQRPDCRLVTVTIENRDRLAEELVTELQERLDRGEARASP